MWQPDMARRDCEHSGLALQKINVNVSGNKTCCDFKKRDCGRTVSVGSGLACKSVRSRDITISAWSVSTGNRFGGEETLSRRVKLLMLQRRSNFQSTGNRFGGGVTSVKHSTTLCYVLVFCLKFTGSQFGSQLRYLKSFLPHVSPERGDGGGLSTYVIVRFSFSGHGAL